MKIILLFWKWISLLSASAAFRILDLQLNNYGEDPALSIAILLSDHSISAVKEFPATFRTTNVLQGLVIENV